MLLITWAIILLERQYIRLIGLGCQEDGSNEAFTGSVVPHETLGWIHNKGTLIYFVTRTAVPIELRYELHILFDENLLHSSLITDNYKL